MASPRGDALSKDQAVPFIVNFQIADVDGDGKISADEFKQACGKGMVKNTTGQ
jgi:Ca2+-binding EF-hand superfamily protein